VDGSEFGFANKKSRERGLNRASILVACTSIFNEVHRF
jgi:hypothetical protein